MREYIVTALILLFVPPVASQTIPPNWQIVKDTAGLCQIAVPQDWAPWRDSSGAAVLHDATTAIAIVTSQPQQEFKPLPEVVQKTLEIPDGKMFENSAKRVFYQDRTSSGREDPNAYTVSVPGKSGTCSGHVTFLPSVAEDIARKIALSLGPAPARPAGTN